MPKGKWVLTFAVELSGTTSLGEAVNFSAQVEINLCAQSKAFARKEALFEYRRFSREDLPRYVHFSSAKDDDIWMGKPYLVSKEILDIEDRGL